MEQLLPFIQDYGFPVVVTFYLLHRIEVKLDTLNQSILMLPERMAEPTYAADLNTKKQSN
ncbi:YvrJ protein family [Schinkia azotoformans MEV2011]|uniref:YvrJ protein family n=1 Tax=Schinkia azotoformans MEV2011 TaxID=1348973 RepID=A0A072NIU4_SCHAZ|nr:YvrJ family protein [Schinkia azotoformans]KEF37162.1 YvrJ protein family [Schinkia azotoformans MEV2011]MEC1695439.1 YvrJ family protein [Schinkia azotoformans]MEC1725719.1 YvrJ family protein [Schinkia azotoformans]MEC1741778.1 YvrJ family protein [Schinkia azotoformans]MEC1746059.1 YvrJ family protein [Schinkia azotoformans]